MFMKLGIITDSVHDKITGIGNYTKNLCISLNKYKNIDIKYIDYEENKFNKEKLIKINNRFPFLKTYLWHNYLPLQLNRINFDYVLNTSGCPHIFPYKYKEILFIYDFSLFVAPETHPSSRVLIYKLLLSKTIKNCHKIVVISQSTKLDLMKYYQVPEDKITVIYPSFIKPKLSQKKPKVKIEEPYILYLGTLEPRKNISMIISAFSQLKSTTLLNYQLVIAGKKGWGYKQIFDTVNNLGLDKKVIFPGYITEAEKKYLYTHAELFVYPSIYEGFGIPPLEAMSYGCPVITSNVSSLPEVIGDAGIMVDPQNVKGLVLAIDKVIKSKKLKNEMIKKGLQQAMKYYSSHNIERLFAEKRKK